MHVINVVVVNVVNVLLFKIITINQNPSFLISRNTSAGNISMEI